MLRKDDGACISGNYWITLKRAISLSFFIIFNDSWNIIRVVFFQIPHVDGEQNVEE